MTLKLYAHPFSSYCQKVLTALYENDTPFAYRMLGEEQTDAELEALWPIKRFPVLVDDDRTIMEAIVIIEHLGLYHPGPVRLIPQDPKEALDVRLMDRFFDNYVMTPMQKIVFDCIRQEKDRDPCGVAEARRCSTGPMAGSTRRSPGANGRREHRSAPPIARRLRRCSMPTVRAVASRSAYGKLLARRLRGSVEAEATVMSRPAFARADRRGPGLLRLAGRVGVVCAAVARPTATLAPRRLDCRLRRTPA